MPRKIRLGEGRKPAGDCSPYISEFFTLDAFIHSDDMKRNGVRYEEIPPLVLRNVKALAKRVLDPIRLMYGKPIYIESGYRSSAFNDMVRGSKGSAHIKGCAVDFAGCPRTAKENKRLFKLIAQSDICFDQLRYEKNGRCVHVSYYPNKHNRRQVLTI